MTKFLCALIALLMVGCSAEDFDTELIETGTAEQGMGVTPINPCCAVLPDNFKVTVKDASITGTWGSARWFTAVAMNNNNATITPLLADFNEQLNIASTQFPQLVVQQGTGFADVTITLDERPKNQWLAINPYYFTFHCLYTSQVFTPAQFHKVTDCYLVYNADTMAYKGQLSGQTPQTLVRAAFCRALAFAGGQGFVTNASCGDGATNYYSPSTQPQWNNNRNAVDPIAWRDTAAQMRFWNNQTNPDVFEQELP